MAGGVTVEQIVPLVEALPPPERVRLLRLIVGMAPDDTGIYALIPPASEEFSGMEDPLAWDSDGWENIP